jgi:hypothetical protein
LFFHVLLNYIHKFMYFVEYNLAFKALCCNFYDETKIIVLNK